MLESRRIHTGFPVDSRIDDRQILATPVKASQWVSLRELWPAAPSNKLVTMHRRTVFTTQSPLPSSVSEAGVVQCLHDHGAMIAQNPLVVHYERCPPPADAPADESHAVWYQLTDRIDYLPGLLKGHVRYRACFHDTPRGLQTHIYAPMGVDIRNHWSVQRGTSSGEPKGLYLQERVEMRCPLGTTGFVRRTLTRAHRELVARLGQDQMNGQRNGRIEQSIEGPRG